MVGVVFHHRANPMFREFWAMIIECFGLSNAWEVACNDQCDSNYNVPVKIAKYEDIPSGHTLVIACHKNAKYIQGTIDLEDYTHPTNCIYVFGDDEGNIDEDMFSEFTIVKVYVDVQYEMYSHQIAAMFFYDRKKKSSS